MVRILIRAKDLPFKFCGADSLSDTPRPSRGNGVKGVNCVEKPYRKRRCELEMNRVESQKPSSLRLGDEVSKWTLAVNIQDAGGDDYIRRYRRQNEQPAQRQ